MSHECTNVKTFGAAGDGLTDDTKAVQGALDDAWSKGRQGVGGSNGGEVFVPPGVYRITQSLRLREGVQLFGVGAASILSYEGTDVCLDWMPIQPGFAINASIAHLKLVAHPSPALPTRAQAAIRITDGYCATIREVWIDGAGLGFDSAAVVLDCSTAGNCANSGLLHCHIQNCLGDGVRIGARSAGIWILHTRIQANEGWGIRCGSGHPNWAQVQVDYCVIEGNSQGGVTGSFYASGIRSCHLEMANLPAIPLAPIPLRPQPAIAVGQGDSFEGLEIHGNQVGIKGGRTGIDLSPGFRSDGLSLRGNRLTGDALTNEAPGIVLRNIHGSSVGDNFAKDQIPVLAVADSSVDGLDYHDGRDRIFNVRGYGAVGDGRTDDVAAIMRAIAAALRVNGGEVFFPVGTYLVGQVEGILLDSPLSANPGGPGRWLRLRGASRTGCTLKAGVGCQYLLQCRTVIERLEIEELTFDDDFVTSMAVSLAVAGRFIWEAQIRRCDFRRFHLAVGLLHMAHVRIADCLFDGAGTGTGSAITLTEGAGDISVEQCRFLWVGNGIQNASATGSAMLTENLRIEGCYFDLGWYTLPAIHTGEGPGVSYDDSSLTDSGTAFVLPPSSTPPGSKAVTPYSYFRALPLRCSGIADVSFTRLQLVDVINKHFVAKGIVVGDIVRAESGANYKAFAVVSGVESDTTLRVEEWLDDKTRQPTGPPPKGSGYVVCEVLLGRVDVPSAIGSSSKVTLDYGWRNLRGEPVRPADGTRYEYLPRPNYPIHLSNPDNTGRILIRGNVVKRGYADQISVWCNRATICENDISDGQDMGVTINTTTGQGHVIISNNRIHHHGAGGIFVGEASSNLIGSHVAVNSNIITGTPWVNAVAGVRVAPLILRGCQHVVANGNIIDGQSLPLAATGVFIGDGAQSILLTGNLIRNVSGHAVTVDRSATGIRISQDNILDPP